MAKTFTVQVPQTYREGYGVVVMPVWDEEGRISEVHVDVVEISDETVMVQGGTVCALAPSYGFWVPIDNIRDLEDLKTDDTHDLRDRWFATREEAERHAKDVRDSWEHPNPWQSFVVTH